MRLISTGGAQALSTSVVLSGIAAIICTAFLAVPAGAATDADEILDAPRVTYDYQHAAPPSAEMPSAPKNFDETDTVAALEGIRIALTEVGDGGTYVWHRRDGKLSGMAQPTASFRDLSGQPCRHLVVMLSSFSHSSKVEGIACRLEDRSWQLTG